jgi:hypothetical protein
MTTTKTKPDEEETKGLGLSPATVAGGALASVTSTVAASSLGTAGTIWGAGVGSIISTIAAALYTHTLKRGTKTLSTVIPVNAPAGSTAVPGRDSTKVMNSPIPGDDTKVLPTRLDPRKPKGSRFDIKLDRKFWIKVALAAVGMFVLVMGVITGVELLTQKPVAALVGNTHSTGTTTLGTVTSDTSSTTQAPEDDQQEDTPVTTTTPGDDQVPGEPIPTDSTQRSAESTQEQQDEQEGGTQTTRTAESSTERSTAESTRESTQEDSTQAPARTTAAPDRDTGAADTE